MDKRKEVQANKIFKQWVLKCQTDNLKYYIHEVNLL